MDSAFKECQKRHHPFWIPIQDLLEESMFALYQSIYKSTIEVFLIAVFGGKKIPSVRRKINRKTNHVQVTHEANLNTPLHL